MPRRHPDWIKVKAPGSANYLRLKGILRRHRLHTVCEEARCPNAGECWEHNTATFLILGDTCTRGCRFCAIGKGKPNLLDPEEPRNVGRAVQKLGLGHIVVTSVNRDDLPDGGSTHFAKTVFWIKLLNPGIRVEVLIPDFKGDARALETVVASGVHVLNHNVETVPRLYRRARGGGVYAVTLELLERARAWAPSMVTKTSMMLGLGEEVPEVLAVMRDLVERDVDILTLGQYLRPTEWHLPVARFVHPDEFAELARLGEAMGFAHVEAGPLVRSSYRADRQLLSIRRAKGEIAARAS